MDTRTTVPPTPSVHERFPALSQRVGPAEYNYEHFRTKHLLRDVRRTTRESGVQPGALAPDFELPVVGGNTLRLSSLRGRPVLLHFGSFT
jgi:hypothetical protein